MSDKQIIISFEGIDGSGKTIQAFKLKKYLEQKGMKVRYVKGRVKKTKNYEIITEIENYCEMKEKKMDKALKAGLVAYERAKSFYEQIFNSNEDIIIIDKYKYTSALYMDYRKIDNYFVAAMLNWLPDPDLVLYFDIAPEVAIKRIQKNRENMEKHENIECLTALDSKLKTFFKSKKYIKYINADASEDKVFIQILEILESMKVIRNVQK